MLKTLLALFFGCAIMSNIAAAYGDELPTSITLPIPNYSPSQIQSSTPSPDTSWHTNPNLHKEPAIGLPPTVLDSFVRSSGMSNTIYGDESTAWGPRLLDDNFMATKIPTGWEPFVAVGYLLLGENNNTYLASIKKSVQANWQPPPVPTTSMVSLEINQDGTITGLKMFCPSGNQQYDQAALDAVLRTAQFTRPPKDLRLSVQIVLTFNSYPRLTENERTSSYFHNRSHQDYPIFLARPKPLKPQQSK